MLVIDVMSKRDRLVITLLALLCIPLFVVDKYLWNMDTAHSLKMICTFLFLIPAAYIDQKLKIIPNKLLPAGIFIAAAYIVYDLAVGNAQIIEKLWACLLGAILGAAVFALAAAISKGGVGMGDIKLFGVLGLILELQYTFSIIFYTLLCAAVYGICMMILKKADGKTRIAVAPFALSGLAITILAGG
jgi:Flp pilus assembly protein protease CpaA